MTAPPALASPEYLEALYEMAEEGIPLVQARLAQWLGVSRASASEAVKRLVRDGLVNTSDRSLSFTDEGERLAQTLVRRHRLAEHFLIRIIGLPWHKAHEEASRWERVISPDVEERMVVILEDPPTCPHGNPIPGASTPVDHSRLVPLHDVHPGSEVVLRRLTEDLELDLDVMRFFEQSGLMPGARIHVHGVGPDGTMNLRLDGEAVALGGHLADNLWVEPA
jgi:DtxR family transcriptional regulator, Mn-dependent transcriptional regulator